MRTLAHFSVVAGFAVLAGCARMGLPPPPPVPPMPCHAGTGSTICVVTVKVTGCKEADIVADPERAKVPRGLAGDVEWRLVAPLGWRFTVNGIVFKDPANGEFVNKRHGNTVFKWENLHRGAKEHWYTIEITDGTQVCTKDPSIMN